MKLVDAFGLAAAAFFVCLVGTFIAAILLAVFGWERWLVQCPHMQPFEVDAVIGLGFYDDGGREVTIPSTCTMTRIPPP